MKAGDLGIALAVEPKAILEIAVPVEDGKLDVYKVEAVAFGMERPAHDVKKIRIFAGDFICEEVEECNQ